MLSFINKSVKTTLDGVKDNSFFQKFISDNPLAFPLRLLWGLLHSTEIKTRLADFEAEIGMLYEELKIHLEILTKMQEMYDQLPALVNIVESELNSSRSRLQNLESQQVKYWNPSTQEQPFSATLVLESGITKATNRLGKDWVDKYKDNPDYFYTLFSELGGDYSQVIIQNQFIAYEDYLPKSTTSRFLDIGCGAGEFLKFIKNKNLLGLGVEIDSSEATRARDAGLDIIEGDGVEYLKETKEKFCGISLLQVIEHIDPEKLKSFVESMATSLDPGGVVFIETINIRHPLAINGFFTDPTHTRPVPDDFLTFLLEWAGFTSIKKIFTYPVFVDPVSKYDLARIYYNYTLVGEKPK